MKKVGKIIKKIIISVVGFPVVIIGIILIPLPGPGILVTLFGLFILSFAFESMKPHLEKYKNMVKKVVLDAKQKQDKFIDKHK